MHKQPQPRLEVISGPQHIKPGVLAGQQPDFRTERRPDPTILVPPRVSLAGFAIE